MSVQEQRLARIRPTALLLLFCFCLQLFPPPVFAEAAPKRKPRVHRTIDLNKCPQFDLNGLPLSPELAIPGIPRADNPLAWANDEPKPSEETSAPDSVSSSKDDVWFKSDSSSTASEPAEESKASSAPAAPTVKRYQVYLPQAPVNATTETTGLPPEKPSPFVASPKHDKPHHQSPSSAAPKSPAKPTPSVDTAQKDSKPNPSNSSVQSSTPKSPPASGSASSSSSKPKSPEAPKPRVDDKKPNHDSQRCDDDDRDDDGDHHHGSDKSGNRLGLVLPPKEFLKSKSKRPAIRGTSSSWSRLTSQFGSYFPVDSTTIESFVNDYALVHSFVLENMGSGKTTLVWDLVSSDSSKNKTARKSYASVQFVVTNFGQKASDKGARYTIEFKSWDQSNRQGKKFTTLSGAFHQLRYNCFSGFNVIDAGNYTFKEFKNGALIKSSPVKVSDLPKPALAWMRRNAGQYGVIMGTFAARASDEWFVHRKTYDYPRNRKKIEWNWLAPAELKLNTTSKRSYMSVLHEYETRGNRWVLQTTVFDRLHPKGWLYKETKGVGSAPPSDLYYGVGIPSIGEFRLQEKIDGVETENFKLEGRYLGSSIQLPRDAYVDAGNVRLQAAVTTAPASYIEKTFVYVVKIRDKNTGQLLRQIRNQIVDNTKNTVNFEPKWDGKDSQGNQIPSGTEIVAEMSILVPRNVRAEQQAMPAFIQQMAQGRRNVPQRQREIPVPHHHSKSNSPKKPWRSNGTHQGQGQNAGGSGSAGDLIAQDPIDEEQFTVSSADPSIGVFHNGIIQIVPNGDEDKMVSGREFTIADQDNPLYFNLTDTRDPDKSMLDSVTIRFVGTDCGEFGPIWIQSSKGMLWYIGSESDYDDPTCQTEITIANISAIQLDEYSRGSAVSSSSIVSRYAADTAPNSRVSPAGIGVKVSNGRYEVHETDLAVASPGLPIIVTRNYFPTQADQFNSFTSEPAAPMSTSRIVNYRNQFGWVWNFQRNLVTSSDFKTVIYRTGTGRDDIYELQGAGYVAKRSDDLKVLKKTGSTYTVTHKSGLVETFQGYSLPNTSEAFNLPGAYLTQVKDTFNNTLTYEYDPSDTTGLRCKKITSNTGQSVLINYRSETGVRGLESGTLTVNTYLVNAICDGNVTTHKVEYQYETVFPALTDSDSGAIEEPGGYILNQVDEPENVRTVYKYGSDKTYQEVGAEALPSWATLSPSALLDYNDRFAGNTDLVPYLEEVFLNGVRQNHVTTTYKSGPIATAIEEQNFASYSITYAPTEFKIIRIPAVGNTSMTQEWKYKLDSKQRVTEKLDPQNSLEKFEYDDQQNITKYTDPKNDVTVIGYGSDKRMNVHSITDAKLNTATIVYGKSFDRPTSITKSGETTSLDYDSDTRALINIKEPVLNGVSETVITPYPNGLVHTIKTPSGDTWEKEYHPVTGALTKVKAPGGAEVKYVPDGRGRTKQVTYPGPSARNVFFTYDNRDRMVTTTENITATNTIGTSFNTTVTSFSNVTYTPFDAVSASTDAMNHTTTIVYDPANQRPIGVIRPDDTTLNVTYHENGQIKTMTNGNRLDTVYDYFPDGQLKSVAYPGVALPEKFTYFPDGLLETTTKTDGSVLSYTYDPNKNLETVSYGGVEKVRYTHDGLDRVTNVTYDGKTENYKYQGSQLWRFTDEFGITEFDYDSSGRRTKRTDPDGSVTNYTFTPRGELETVNARRISALGDIPPFNITYLYNPDGTTQSATYSNGVKAEFLYDSRQRMTTKSYLKGSAPLIKLSRNYDKNNLRVSRAIDYPGDRIEQDITHDKLDQLKSLTQSVLSLGSNGNSKPVGRAEWVWDDNANQKVVNATEYLAGGVTETTSTDYESNDADQVTKEVLTGVDQGLPVSRTTEYNHTEAGGASITGRRAHTFDYKDQLTKVEFLAGAAIGTVIEYFYDPSNRLKERKVNGSTFMKFFWDGDDIVKEYDATNTRKSWYLIGQDREAIYKDGAWHVLFTDEQGSQFGSTDASGNFANARNYAARGGVLNTNASASIQNDFLWHGLRSDEITGAYYARNRWVNNARFLSRDPIRHEGGLNMHAYGNANPIDHTDPTGLQPRLSETFEYDPGKPWFHTKMRFININYRAGDSNSGNGEIDIYLETTSHNGAVSAGGSLTMEVYGLKQDPVAPTVGRDGKYIQQTGWELIPSNAGGNYNSITPVGPIGPYAPTHSRLTIQGPSYTNSYKGDGNTIYKGLQIVIYGDWGGGKSNPLVLIYKVNSDGSINKNTPLYSQGFPVPKHKN